MELSNSNIKKYPIFPETETPKKFLIFSQKKAFLTLQETETLKKFFYFREQNFLIFQEELPKPQKPKFLIFFQKKLTINFSKNAEG